MYVEYAIDPITFCGPLVSWFVAWEQQEREGGDYGEIYYYFRFYCTFGDKQKLTRYGRQVFHLVLSRQKQ